MLVHSVFFFFYVKNGIFVFFFFFFFQAEDGIRVLVRSRGLGDMYKRLALHAGGQRFESVILHSVLIIVL